MVNEKILSNVYFVLSGIGRPLPLEIMQPHKLTV